eukprot:1900133-Rhodomonas_salina.1
MSSSCRACSGHRTPHPQRSLVETADRAGLVAGHCTETVTKPPPPVTALCGQILCTASGA